LTRNAFGGRSPGGPCSDQSWSDGPTDRVRSIERPLVDLNFALTEKNKQRDAVAAKDCEAHLATLSLNGTGGVMNAYSQLDAS